MPRWRRRPEGSNWGDFGEDDQLGRMSLITPERRRVALREAREGIAFALSLPLDYPGGSVLTANRKPPQIIAPERPTGGINYNFAYSRNTPCFTDVVCDEMILMYTQYSTQWDALGHVGQEFDADGDGTPEIVYYNGFRAGEHIKGPAGDNGPCAHRLDIAGMAMTGVQGRGVLVDLEALHGRERALVGYAGLMHALEDQRQEVACGDFLCLHTGFSDVLMECRKQPDATAAGSCAVLDGHDRRLLDWITESGIVAICADNLAVENIDPTPGGAHRHAMMPIHEHCLFKLGVHLGELWHFGELARWLRPRGRSAFLLTAPPLRLPGCVGSPVTPIATV